MGVITTAPIPSGKIFGPVPTNLTLTDPAVLIGHMTADARPDVHSVKINLNEYAEGARLAEWVPYVQAAREEREQNIEAFVKQGQLYYKTLRDLQPNAELCVWYSDDFAQILGVPELQSIHFTENGTMCCPYCGQTFRFPFSLRAHLRFKCDTLRKAMHLDTSIRPSLAIVPPGFGIPMSRAPLPSPAGHSLVTLSPTSSIASMTSSEGTPPPIGHHSRLSPGKRKLEEIGSHDKERSVRSRDSENGSPDSRKSQSVSPVHETRNISREEDTGSAFRKVERHAQLSPGRYEDKPHPVPSSNMDRYSLGPSHQSSPFFSPASLGAGKPLLGLRDNNMNPASLASIYGQYPMGMSMSSFGLRHNENMPLNLADNDSKLSNAPRGLAEKLTDIHNIENNNIYRKMPFYSERRVATNPYFKSQNPMVEKILHSPLAPIPSSFASLSLCQNWCAKCNATFRMTSDLVYHMRSHHHREFDPLKRKREEKLRCDVCGETFRERHHLSRHMTSHVNV